MKESSGALALLSELHQLHQLARLGRRETWFPLIAFGLVDLLGAPLALLVGRAHLGPVLGPGMLLAALLSARHYRAEGKRRGVQSPVWPWVTVILGASVVAATCSFLGRELDNRLLNLGGPTLALIAGFAILAVWSESTVLLGVVGLLVLISLVAVATTNGDAAVSLQLAGGGVTMLASGSALVLRRFRVS